MKLVRTFHPIGHGAFYTERFYDETEQSVANYVFDCGCYEAAKSGMSDRDYEKRIRNAIDAEFKKGDKIDALFISHFHQDHINGVEYLMSHCTISKIYVPAITPEIVIESFLYNYISTGNPLCRANKLLWRIVKGLFSEMVVFIKGKQPIGSRQINWEYILFNPEIESNKQQIIQAFRAEPSFSKVFNGDNVDIDELTKALYKVNIKKCKKIYNDAYGKRHNCYSMTVLSGICYEDEDGKVANAACLPSCLRHMEWQCKGYSNRLCTLNCLYTGDYEAKNHLDKLRTAYKPRLKFIGLIQVPHHGSEHNHNDGLYEPPRLCIISVSDNDKYHHPDKKTIDAIQAQQSIPIMVTEDPKTKQMFTYNLP